MTNCAECRELERQFEEAVEYLLVASTHGPQDEPIKAAKRKMAQIQERFNDHKVSHGEATSCRAQRTQEKIHECLRARQDRGCTEETLGSAEETAGSNSAS